jgi:hypothetical protein
MCENNLSSRAESAEVNASVVCCLQPKVKLLIDGKFQDSKADKWVNVTNPVREALFTADQLSLSAMVGCLQHPSDIPTRMTCSMMPAGKSHQAVCNRYAWHHLCSLLPAVSVCLLSCCLCLQATQEVVSRIPETTAAEFNAAVAAAKAAFPAWRATAVPTRQRVMLKFQELIRANWVSNTD